MKEAGHEFVEQAVNGVERELMSMLNAELGAAWLLLVLRRRSEDRWAGQMRTNLGDVSAHELALGRVLGLVRRGSVGTELPNAKAIRALLKVACTHHDCRALLALWPAAGGLAVFTTLQPERAIQTVEHFRNQARRDPNRVYDPNQTPLH